MVSIYLDSRRKEFLGVYCLFYNFPTLGEERLAWRHALSRNNQGRKKGETDKDKETGQFDFAMHRWILFPMHHEIDVLKCVDHRAFLKFFFEGQVSKEYIYVIEKFDHLSLAQIMEKNGAPFEESIASEIFAQIVDGIHHLHTCNFKHRQAFFLQMYIGSLGS